MSLDATRPALRTRHRRPTQWLAAMVVVAGLAVPLPAETKAFLEVEGVVSMEAENATELRGFLPRQDGMGAEPSGGFALEDAGGQLRYLIRFEHPGRYYVWARMAKPQSGYPSDKANDCTLRFDGKPLNTSNGTTTWTVIGLGTHHQSLTWQSRPKSHESAARDHHVYLEVPGPGDYHLDLVSRSPGFLIDKLVLIHAQQGGDAEGGGPGLAARTPKILNGMGPPETGIPRRR